MSMPHTFFFMKSAKTWHVFEPLRETFLCIDKLKFTMLNLVLVNLSTILLRGDMHMPLPITPPPPPPPPPPPTHTHTHTNVCSQCTIYAVARQIPVVLFIFVVNAWNVLVHSFVVMFYWILASYKFYHSHFIVRIHLDFIKCIYDIYWCFCIWQKSQNQDVRLFLVSFPMQWLADVPEGM